MNEGERIPTPDHGFGPLLQQLHASLSAMVAAVGRRMPEVAYLCIRGPIPPQLEREGLREALERYRATLGRGAFEVGPTEDQHDGSSVWVMEKSSALFVLRRMIGDDDLGEPMQGQIYPGEVPVIVFDPEAGEVLYHKFAVLPDVSN